MPNMPDIKLTRTDEIFELDMNKIKYTGKCHMNILVEVLLLVFIGRITFCSNQLLGRDQDE